jgi:hypothetical protein
LIFFIKGLKFSYEKNLGIQKKREEKEEEKDRGGREKRRQKNKKKKEGKSKSKSELEEVGDEEIKKDRSIIIVSYCYSSSFNFRSMQVIVYCFHSANLIEITLISFLYLYIYLLGGW